MNGLKYKNIITLLFTMLPICIVLRTLQAIYTIDSSTGFMINDNLGTGIAMLAAAGIITALCAVCASTVRRLPQKLPEGSVLLGVGSLAMSIGFAFELAFEIYATRIPAWQITTLKALSAASALFMLAFAFSCFAGFKLPRVLFVLPVFYGIVKLLLTFTEISAIPIITDNVLAVLANAAVLFFLLQVAKIANGIVNDKTHRVTFAAAVCAIFLCAVTALPTLYMCFAYPTSLLHTSVASAVFELCAGTFAALFILSFFSLNNLKKAKKEKKQESESDTLGTETAGNLSGISYFSALPEVEEKAHNEGFTVKGFDDVLPSAEDSAE